MIFDCLRCGRSITAQEVCDRRSIWTAPATHPLVKMDAEIHAQEKETV